MRGGAREREKRKERERNKRDKSEGKGEERLFSLNLIIFMYSTSREVSNLIP
jgi:hypothetical protein